MEIKKIYNLPKNDPPRKLKDLNFYLDLATKILWKTASTRYGEKLANNLLTDEDAISNAALELMKADLKHDKNKSKLSTWRITYIKWYISTYCYNRDQQIKKKPAYSLFSHSEFSQEAAQNIPGKDNIVNNAIRQETRRNVRRAIETAPLTKQHRDFIKEYYIYEVEAFKRVGEKFGLTTERARQVVTQARRILKRHIETHYPDLVVENYPKNSSKEK